MGMFVERCCARAVDLKENEEKQRNSAGRLFYSVADIHLERCSGIKLHYFFFL